MTSVPPTGPVPNTPGLGKFVALGTGVAAGVATTVGLRHALVEPDRAAELGDRPVLDSREASLVGGGLAFGGAAGVALGTQKRGPTAGLTTATQIGTAALLSTVAGMVINSESDKAVDYAVGIGAMGAATGAGIIYGVRDESHPGRVRMTGLALAGVAAGALLPTIVDAAGGITDAVATGIEHRE